VIIPDFLVPFGPLHIVFLHLPIGALVALCFVLFVLPNDGKKHRNSVIGHLHLFLVFSTAITIVLGLAYQVHGQFEEELDLHVLWGYIFGGAVLVNYMIYWVHRMLGAGWSRLLYLISLTFATVAMAITGHQGGDLVHGKGFLTKPFQSVDEPPYAVLEPIPVPVLVPLPAEVLVGDSMDAKPSKKTPLLAPIDITPLLQSLLNFPLLKPILSVPLLDPIVSPLDPETETSSSVQETMGDAPSAEVTPVFDMGMSGGAVSVPNEVSASADDAAIELFEAAHLVFKNHCYNCHGATKQKGGLRLDREGDAFAGGDAGPISIVPRDVEGSLVVERMRLPRDDDDAMPPESKPAVAVAELEAVVAWIQAGAVWPDARARAKQSSTYIEVVDEAAEVLIAQMNATGAKAEYNSWDDRRIRVDLSFTDADKLEAAIAQLGAFGDQVFWLDAGGLVLPDTFYGQLIKLKNLERLFLNGTNVKDVDLEAVATLKKLMYLNLFNTEVTNQGSDKLKSLPSLQRVFLGDTQVSKDGAKRLAESRESLSVVYR
jgi:mono/diheme cytochrome c family protein